MRTTLPARRSWFLLTALVGMLSLALVACDSGGDNGGNGGTDESFPEPPGRPGFASTVTGAWQASLSGAAVHTIDEASNGGASPVVIRLRDADGGSPTITLVATRPLRPGTYAIQPSGAAGVTVRIHASDARGPWIGTSGTLRIDRHDGTSITGRFRLVADDEDGVPISASGVFVTTPAP